MFVEYGFLLGEIIPEDFRDVYVRILGILVFAYLVDIAFVGQLGLVELAIVGVSIALFNQVSRITIFPFVSFTTSFVAEEDTIGILDSEPEVSKNVEIMQIWAQGRIVWVRTKAYFLEYDISFCFLSWICWNSLINHDHRKFRIEKVSKHEEQSM